MAEGEWAAALFKDDIERETKLTRLNEKLIAKAVGSKLPLIVTYRSWVMEKTRTHGVAELVRLAMRLQGPCRRQDLPDKLS